MRLAAIAGLALAAGGLLLLRPPAAGAQPQVTFIFPEEGTILAEPPGIVRMCFASPVNIRDLHDGGDFKFSVLPPDGRGLGLRIVFQRDGLGVDVHPGLPEEPPDGEWTFEWRVTDPDTLEPATGTVRFTVGPDGSPVPEEPPKSCAESGTPTPDVSPASDAEETDDGPDTLLLALITAAVVGAAVLAPTLYLVRRRIGSRPSHPPPPEGGEDSEGP